ncbi:hypothetical protein [Bradyrhizobium sp.]|uniref:hypothetical protein n=1 Tax=Bradyrhizobium sp. TaxID=376 RepID=UPI0039E6A8F6
MLKYLAKISMDIFPSVLATIIGAYIVNHYINARPAADTPAAVVAPAQAGKPADVANLPAPGVKAKGIAEKSVVDKPVAEKPADKSAEQPAKAADAAPGETAPANSRARTPAHEKTAAKSTSGTEANAAPAATPDANDLARAAIERLRKSPEYKSLEAKSLEGKSPENKLAERSPEPVVLETPRGPEAGPRVQEGPRVTALPAAVRPLPPPITVSTPPSETYGNGAVAPENPSYTASVDADGGNRLTPPADIPVPVIAPPLDLRADAGAPMPRPKTNVADDMLSGVKSMFHAVLPKSATPN